MKQILIVGASGMIGNLILQKCLDREDVKNVISIVRKSSQQQHPKLKEIIHTDFLDFNTIADSLLGIDICFYCVGVYTGQVPSEEFKKITVDYTKALAIALHHQSQNASFCFLSGQGADSKEQSNVLFAKQKGIAENSILKLAFLKTHIFRPGYIYPVTPRKEPNIFYKLMRVLYKPISFIYPNIGVSSEQLANKMVAISFGTSQQIVFENRDIRSLAN